MKPIAAMSAEELAGLVCDALRKANITVTLTGGACVGIWADAKYVSDDLDFVEEGPVPRSAVREVMGSLGFRAKGRYFVHPATRLFVEFPTGPLMVGDQRVNQVSERKTPSGILRLLSPTDCVKDRLAAFFHWNDRQALEQALLVAHAQEVDVKDVRDWSTTEKNLEKFIDFEKRLKALRREKRKRS